MRHLMLGRDDVISYLDDMRIYNTNLNDHINGAQHMLDRIRQSWLTIRPTKTYVAVKEVTFLGYTLKQGKIMPKSSLVGKIISIQVPKTKKQIRPLLDLINFYSIFVTKYADIVACLTELTVGTMANNHMKLSTRHDEAPRDIQRTLSSKPFLRIPDLSQDFYVF